MTGQPEHARGDRGTGSQRDYVGQLVPRTRRVRIRLAGSDPHQDEIVRIAADGTEGIETAIARRSQRDEAVDAPIEVRLFTGSRVSGPVGWVPRGLESVVDEAFGRLEEAGRKPRIPVRLVHKPGRWRVELLIGLTRD